MNFSNPQLLILTIFLFNSLLAQANHIEQATPITEIQQRWAELNYSYPKSEESLAALEALAEETEFLVIQRPHSADIKIWSGIVLSTLANQKGGLAALKMVKIARLRFEDALSLDPAALDGSAYTSLATLYHKVPGWPIAFGSSKKAKSNFENALTINPNGLEINYFYAEFLAENKQKEMAIKHLHKALAAPTLTGRPVADAGRRAEAQSLLSKLLTGLG